MRRHEKMKFSRRIRKKDLKFEVETGTKDLRFINYHGNDALWGFNDGVIDDGVIDDIDAYLIILRLLKMKVKRF